MSLFQCYACGCRENTATCNFWSNMFGSENYQWRSNPSEPWMLCSACDPKIHEWHGMFDRLYLPKGEFKTNGEGNLEHIATGVLAHEFVAEGK